MFSRLTFGAAALSATIGQADPIAQLAFDWNGDGHLDRVTLEHSYDHEGRADLLLYEGTAEASGSNLILVAADFARAPDHPNMGLTMRTGDTSGTFSVTETGTALGPEFWQAETYLRYADGFFVVDRKTTEQIPPIHRDNQFGCSVDFVTKFAGGGNDALSDAWEIATDPIPLAYWTPATFLQFVEQIGPEICEPFDTSFESFLTDGNVASDEVTLDWNADGYTDRLVLSPVFSDASLFIFMGDAAGKQQLHWIARNLGPTRTERVDLRRTPGLPNVVEVTSVAWQDPEKFGKDDIAVRLLWNENEPVISRLTVWSVISDGAYASECTWYFDRGKFMSDFTKAWVDEPDFASLFSLEDWAAQDLAQIAWDCRP